MADTNMAPAVAMQTTGGRQPLAKCGARGRKGKPCARGAGWGTDHPGFGQCRNHGGSTASGKAHAAKLAAVAQARRDFGAEQDIDPLEAMLYTVRRGRALASYWRQRAVELAGDEEKFERAAKMEAGALDDLNRWSHGAVKAGVAERLVRITERTAERLASAFEDALAGVDLPGEVVAEMRRRYAAGLFALEQGDVIDGQATDITPGMT